MTRVLGRCRRSGVVLANGESPQRTEKTREDQRRPLADGHHERVGSRGDRIKDKTQKPNCPSRANCVPNKPRTEWKLGEHLLLLLFLLLWGSSTH